MSDMKSGVEYVREMQAAAPAAGMHALLGLAIASVDEGKCSVTGTPEQRFYNHQGRVHGGYLATVIDTALGLAVQTALPAETGYGTVELKVNYVRKLDVTVGQITCTGTVLHAGRTMLTAEAKVLGADGKLYAHGSGTFLVYPK